MEISKNCIHVERVNARLKEFRILDLQNANVLVQLLLCLCESANPLIKKIASALVVD